MPRLAVVRPLPWWIWPKLLGPVVMVASLALPGVPTIVVALSAHVLGDYTLLTPGMCRARASGSQAAMLAHAIIAGGLPGAIAGGPRGFILCAAVHWAVDMTRKFGRDDWRGIAADQLCHVAAIAAAYLCR